MRDVNLLKSTTTGRCVGDTCIEDARHASELFDNFIGKFVRDAAKIPCTPCVPFTDRFSSLSDVEEPKLGKIGDFVWLDDGEEVELVDLENPVQPLHREDDAALCRHRTARIASTSAADHQHGHRSSCQPIGRSQRASCACGHSRAGRIL